MKIEYDSAKRDTTLLNRNLDMADAFEVFQGCHTTFPDIRFDYGEDRYITVGFIEGRMIILAWTQRNDVRRIISMRKANDREKTKFAQKLGR